MENWPPATAPSWPPSGYSSLEFGSLAAAQIWAKTNKIQDSPPNGAQRAAFFTNARCDAGHTVTGRIFTINGVEYPFARCDVDHPYGNGQFGRQFLVLWAPYVWGVS